MGCITDDFYDRQRDARGGPRSPKYTRRNAGRSTVGWLAGYGIRQVQTSLGHSHVKTTAIYARRMNKPAIPVRGPLIDCICAAFDPGVW
jgi:integrase